MNYQETLDDLYGLQRFGVKLGLANMRGLVARLPELQQPMRCVHVAGTNGKGSVSTMLAEILRGSGLRVGLYTSPHLHCFTERIRVDGRPISRDDVTVLAAVIREAAEGIPLTFFEATTAMALLAFQRHEVDFAVIETGLGGRLDATNIVSPELCLITPVSLDHQEHLGDTLALIAREKAGIVKPGVPVIAGCQKAVVVDVLRAEARRQRAPFFVAGEDYRWHGEGGELTVQVGAKTLSGLRLSLPGGHQQDNFAQAIAAALALHSRGVPVSSAAIRAAGQNLEWPARLEWWRGERRILLDAAHNAEGCRSLADYLQNQGIRKVHMIAGLSGERLPEAVLSPLRPLISKLYHVPVPGAESVAEHEVIAWADANQVTCASFADPESGLTAALLDAGRDEPLVVCGSLYLTAEIRGLLAKTDSKPVSEVVGFV